MTLNMPHEEMRRTRPADTPENRILTAVCPEPESSDWRARSGCRGINTDMFFPVGTSHEAQAQTRYAKKVCGRCPVLTKCRTWALDTGQEGGIFGGMTERERRRALRARTGLKGTTMSASLLEMAQALKVADQWGPQLRQWLADGVMLEQMAKRMADEDLETPRKDGIPRIRVVRWRSTCWVCSSRAGMPGCRRRRTRRRRWTR
jgi:WhiB family redox-sensing transcriptional regulator